MIRAALTIAVITSLAGCYTMPPPAPPQNPPEDTSSTAAAMTKPSDESPESTETPPNQAGSSAADAPLPPCLPTDNKPKPKRARPRPRTVESAAAAPAPQTAPAAPTGGATDAVVKPLENPVISILGKKVEDPNGEDVGRVVDVLADANGRVRVAIVEFGGFLGVGNRRIAVEWPLLRFHTDDKDKPLILNVSRKKLQTAPEYKDVAHPQALMAPSTEGQK